MQVRQNSVPLTETREQVLKHFHRLWGFSVKLETIDGNGEIVSSEECTSD